jgi:hypothetical protein
MHDDYLYYDSAFEDFAQDSGFLTNFSSHQYSHYVASVQAYALINPSVELVIDKGWKCEYALYIKNGRQDLSAFWRLFETLEGA